MQTRTIRIDPRSIKLLPLNARFMRYEVFQRLVANVKKDGALTQIPFGIKDEDGNWLVLSGNHRVKAAIEAGLPEIDFQVTDDPLTDDQKTAIQLSHNEISGEDDPALLRTLYMSIHDPQFKLYTGFDDNRLKLLDDVKTGSLAEPNLTFQTISMAFLPPEVEQVNAAWEAARKASAGCKGAWLNSMDEYDQALDAIALASEAHTIKNTATALMIVLEVFSRHLGDLADGWYEDGESRKGSQNVPLATALGSDHIPAKSAAIIKKALDRMAGRGEIESSKRWQALEKWATAYLNTEQQGA